MQNENADFLTVILKFGLIVMLIMAIVFVLAVLTPWMAKQVDKMIARMKKKENPAQEEVDPRCAQVKGIYDVSSESPEDTPKSSQEAAATDTDHTEKEV